jgi:ankyrin repeat protein
MSYSRQQARQEPLVLQGGRKNADLFTGYAYYSVLDPSTLAQLEAQSSGSTGTSELFTNDVLFGMAIRVLVLTGNQHRERAARYFQAAAKRSNLPAKAISKRIRDAVKSNGNLIAPDVDVNQWLFEGASSGSLIAMEDLRQENPGLAQVARHEFIRLGGFNKNISPTVRDHVIRLSQGLDLTYDFNKAIDDHGNRPLHYAASYGLASLIEQFVNSGASVDQRNHQGETPLYKACLAADVECVKILVEQGADASLITTHFGISCLHWLFNFDEVSIKDIAHLLVLKGAPVGALTQHVKDSKVIRQIPSEHFPFHWPQGAPIHWAAFARSTVAIDALLENGASVDDLDAVEDVHAQTALSMAVYRGDSLMVKHLLSKGANPNRLDGTGCSPAHMMAIDSTRKNRLFNMPNALRWWVYHGSWQNHVEELTKCARALADQEGNLNAQTRSRGSNDNLSSPILDAVQDKNAGALLALLNAGASADCAISFSGETPFHIWAGVGSQNLPYAEAFSAVCAMLSRSVRDLDVRDSNGKSILHRAVECPSDDDFHYLIDLLTRQEPLISLEVTDYDSITPLLQAVQMKFSNGAQHDGVVRANILLDIGAAITARDYDDRDFLFLACQNSEFSDSQCLHLIKKAFQCLPLEAQRDLAQKSISRKKGNTALMCASNNFFLQVVNFLLECGVDANIVSKAGSTALDFVLDSSQRTRQRYLNDWVVHRKLLFENQRFLFNGLDAEANVLRSPAALLDNAHATAKLFQRTLTESDLSK